MTPTHPKLLAILSTIRPDADFATSQSFLADGLLDSFDLVTLVAALDKTYGISIPGTDILPENFGNLEAIAALLRRLGKEP
jgi:acyl carrier protein